MAQVYNNLVIKGLTGSLGRQLVIKRGKLGRTIVSSRPDFRPDRQFSPAQVARQMAFREACAYGVSARSQEIYIQQAEGTRFTPYNLAVADWLRPPKIIQLDLDAWTGQPGKLIRIEALDDVQVKQVTVTITDLAGTLIEEGPATQIDGLWWHYTTTATVSAPGSLKVIASAWDLPGHTTQLTQAVIKT